MPSSAVYELAILLSLRDAASGGLDRFENRLRATGKEGRAMLQTVQDLRKDLRQGLTLAGAGVATLAALKQGIDIAADYESAITDLRSSFAQLGTDGAVNVSLLGNQMTRAEQLATKLGNSLPGSTRDFVEMLQAAKQAGLDVETILNGAGEAMANLAVANNQAPKAIAEDVARFGKLYQLKPEEYTKVTDLFSRIYTSKGVQSNELIEAAKFFQGRAGASLKLTGLEGAEQSTRFLAFMRERGGMEGSEAGTSSSTFLKQLVVNKKALEELKKEYGITLDLFDKQGQFKGFDNAFEQLQKLRTLNPQQQLAALNKLGGEEGARAGTAMVQGGLESWKQFNDEINKTISQQEKVSQKSQDFNNKMEALSGTLQNVVVAFLTPMLDTVKPIADLLNSGATALQEWGKANPEAAKLLAHLVGIGGVLATIIGTTKALTAAWGLYKIASLAGMSEAQRSALSLRDSYQSLPRSIATKTVNLVGILGIGLAIEGVVSLAEEYSRLNAKIEKGAQDAREIYDKMVATGQIYNPKATVSDVQIGGLIGRMNPDEALTSALKRQTGEWASPLDMGAELGRARPFGRSYNPGVPFSPTVAAGKWGQLAPELHDFRWMKKLIENVRGGGLGIQKDDKRYEPAIKLFEESLKLFDPKAYQQATEQLAADNKSLSTEVNFTTESFRSLLRPAGEMPNYFQRANDAVSTFTFRLNSWSPPTINPFGGPFDDKTTGGTSNDKPPVRSPFTPSFDSNPFKPLKSHASRNVSDLQPREIQYPRVADTTAQVSATAFFNKANYSTPALREIPPELFQSAPTSTRRGSLDESLASSSRGDGGTGRNDTSQVTTVHVSYSPQVTVSGGNPNEFARMLYEHGADLERIIKRQLDNGAERAGRNG